MSTPEETTQPELAPGKVLSEEWTHGFLFTGKDPEFKMKLYVFRVVRKEEEPPAEVTRGGCSSSRQQQGMRHAIGEVKTAGQASFDGMLVPVETEDKEDGEVTRRYEIERGGEFALVPVLSDGRRTMAVKEVCRRGGGATEWTQLPDDATLRFVREGEDAYYDIRGDKPYILPHRVTDSPLEIEFYVFTGKVLDGHTEMEERTRTLVARVVVSPEAEVNDRDGPTRGSGGPMRRGWSDRSSFDV